MPHRDKRNDRLAVFSGAVSFIGSAVCQMRPEKFFGDGRFSGVVDQGADEGGPHFLSLDRPIHVEGVQLPDPRQVIVKLPRDEPQNLAALHRWGSRPG